MLLVKQLVQPQLAKNKVKLIFSCLKCSIVTTGGEFLIILASFGFWIETASRPPSSISVFSRLKLTKRDYFILDLERNWRNDHLSRVEHFESFITKIDFWLVNWLETGNPRILKLSHACHHGSSMASVHWSPNDWTESATDPLSAAIHEWRHDKGL